MREEQAARPLRNETIGEQFQELTKYRHFSGHSAMSLGIPPPDPEKPVPAGAQTLELPGVVERAGE